jgi:hypothetical protein
MQFEKLQKAWQSQRRVSIDTGVLLRMLRRDRRGFRSMIIRRDAGEVGAALFCAAFFVYVGVTRSQWSWLVLAFLTAGVGVFMLIDRFWHRADVAAKGGSLADSARSSLAEVRHQVWLLKNIFWWYLLPPGIGLAVVGAEMAYQLWLLSGSLLPSVTVAALLYLIVVVVDVFIYRLNQRAVRDGLEPRVRELESLLSSFEETHTDLSPD